MVFLCVIDFSHHASVHNTQIIIILLLAVGLTVSQLSKLLMYPSRPSSTDPNAAYRDAIAAFADNRIAEQEDHTEGESRYDAAINQPNSLAPLNPRRRTNQDRLNVIAHNLGSGVRVAMEMMAHSATPSATTDVATSSAPPVTVDTIRQYLRENGYFDSNMVDVTIQNRLDAVHLSTETIFTALQILHDDHHPLIARLNMSNSECDSIFYRLAGIVMKKNGFQEPIRTATLNANNNPDQLIANLLQYLRSLR